MPDPRSLPSIRERCDYTRFNQATSVRRWLGYLSWLAALICVLVIVVWTLRGDERVYWSAPVSSSHAMFEHDCRQCHVQTGAPAVRLATLNDAHASVRDQDCQQCHTQSSFDHSPRMQKANVTGCIQCHREHSGNLRLTDVADQHCTQCHRNLETTEGKPHIAAHVASFAGHPDFALWTTQASNGAAAPKFADENSPLVQKDNVWRDRTELKFNHARHLVAGGILTAPPKPGEEAAHADLRKLNCSDCHTPDSAGQYMQPVNYEQHCASCHRLEFSGKLAIGGQLPHEAPEVVFGLMRDRLMKYADAHWDDLSQAGAESRLPNKSLETSSVSQDKWEWVASQLGTTRESVFANVQQGCAYCHTFRETVVSSAEDLGFAIVPPRIPNRWLPGSRFDHRSHREVACVRCHDPHYSERTSQGHPKYNAYSDLASEDSADILLPKIETCRQCHGSAAKLVGSPGVRARCVDCHDYHQHGSSGSEKLEAWLKAKE